MPASVAEPQKPLVRDVLLRDGSSLRLQAPAPVDFDLDLAVAPESRRLQ